MSQQTTSTTTFINVLHIVMEMIITNHKTSNTKVNISKQLFVYMVKKWHQVTSNLLIMQRILALILALTISHTLPLIVLANSDPNQDQIKSLPQKSVNPKQSAANTTQPTITSHVQPVILNNNTIASGTSDHNNQETIPATTSINSSTIPPNDSTLLNTNETEQDKKIDSITTNAANLNKILDDRSVTKNNVPKVEESTGALSFSYPIVVPPGRNGMQPDVALNYNSQDKNIFSPYGYGWSLSVPYIKRYQPTGALNQYSTNTYEFSLGGKLVLAQNQPESGGKAFETRLENGQHWQFLFQNDVWTMRDNLGHTYTFGSTASSRQDNPSWGSYAWMLSEISDTNNNAVRYTYTKQNGQIYPDRINYTYHPETASIYEVRFLWQDAPYPRTSYQSGFKVVTEKRLTKIIVQSNGQIIHQYSIGYQNSISNVIHLISWIREEYLNAQGSLVAKPDTTFEYPDASEVTGWQPTNQIQFPFSSISNGVRFSEFTGDGLIDFMHGSTLYTNGGTQWVPSNPTNGPFISNPMSGTNDSIEMLDYNSDGVTDYFGTTGNVTTNTNYVHPSNFLLNNGNGGYLEDATNIQTPPQVTTANFYYDYLCDHAGLRLLDLNGDGLTDMLQGFRFTRYSPIQGGNQDYYINRAHFADLDSTGKISWQQQPWSNIPVFEYETSGSVSHKIMEMNGDGLPDLLQFAYYTETNPRYVRYEYHTNNTIGWEYLNGIMLPAEAGYATSNRVADINGDGLDDIIIAANYYNSSCNTDCDHRRKVILNHGSVFNDSPNSWQLPDSLYFVRSPSQYSADTDVNPHGAFADVNGDGAQDIIIFQSGGNSVYLNKSAYAYLPKKITLPEGGSLSISYKGSPEYRGENSAWVNHIPFVITTVEKVSSDDGFGNISMDTYFYENGTYVSRNSSITDPRFMLERQASFGKVTLTKADGSKIVTYYHQGNGNTTNEVSDDIAKIGKSYRQEIYNQNGDLARTIVTQWDKQDLFGANSVGHWFVKKTRLVNLDYGSGGTHRDSAITYSYDPQTFAITTETNYGEVTAGLNGSFTDIGNDTLTITRSYVANNQYLNNLLVSQLITNTSGKVAETKYYYDNQALSQATIGNITKQELWVNDTSPYLSTQKTYDTTGFVLTEVNPLSKTTTYTPDSAKLYPASITNPLNQTTQYQYNYAVGRPKQVTDPNGAVFITTYDTLGRMVEEKIPDPISGTPVIKSTYSYNETPHNFSMTKTDYLDAAISTQTISYLDGLGRVLQTRKQTEGNNFFVSDIIYDTVGRVLKQSLPYISTGSGYTTPTSSTFLYTTFAYDGLNRVVNQTNSVSVTTTTYNGWTVSISVIDPNNPNSNRKKDVSKDAFGRIAQVVEYNQNQVYATLYTYNGNDCLTSITDAQGNIRKFTYDGLGRRTSAEDLHHQTDTTFGKWLFTYDEANNLKTIIDPKTQTTRYDYDELNRVKSETLGSQIVFSYVYDSCTNGKGKLCQVATPSSTFIENFKYNLLGQVTESVRTINGTSYKTNIEYDRQGNQTLITNPDDSQVKYIYNTAGLINQVQRKESTTAFSDVITNIDYSPTEQPTLIRAYSVKIIL